jgi:hypothetical protein
MTRPRTCREGIEHRRIVLATAGPVEDVTGLETVV